MTTTAILAVVGNLIISVVSYLYCMKEINECPIMKSYYEAQGKVMNVLSWTIAILMTVLTYWLVLWCDGFWNTIGWVLLVIDTISMIVFTAIIKFIGGHVYG